MAYTSLQIIKRAVNVWTFHDNEMPDEEEKYSNVYSDIVTGDLLTFTTKTGQIIYSQIAYWIVSYIDETDPSNNFTPSSALQLHTYLLNDGFFGSSSGGGGGATTLLGLTDALIANYAGRGGQALIIGPDENGFTSVPFSNVTVSTQLGDMPQELLANKYLTTNSDGTMYQLSDIDLIINTPIAYSVLRVIQKGYTWSEGTIIPNVEPFIEEVGDIFSGIIYDAVKEKVMFYPAMRWKGGDKTNTANFVIPQGWNMPFDTDPDYEE